jgi:DNA-binding GntR family transcriptional regulator
MSPRRTTVRARGQRVRRTRDTSGLSSSERAYRRLKEMILVGELVPGRRLVELDLAAQFGMSRTPVREALKRLIDGKLILVDPTRMYTVRKAEIAEIEEVYLVREMLDGLAARLATQRIQKEGIAGRSQCRRARGAGTPALRSRVPDTHAPAQDTWSRWDRCVIIFGSPTAACSGVP